jgi:hypothetical protein
MTKSFTLHLSDILTCFSVILMYFVAKKVWSNVVCFLLSNNSYPQVEIHRTISFINK